MKITKERFNELGLGCNDSDCIYYQDCQCCGYPPYEIYIGCYDEERLSQEMTAEEYDAYKHNRLEVEE